MATIEERIARLKEDSGLSSVAIYHDENVTVCVAKSPVAPAHYKAEAADLGTALLRLEVCLMREKLDKVKESPGRVAKAIQYLEERDNRLLAGDGTARDTLEGCEKALRDVYCILTLGMVEEK